MEGQDEAAIENTGLSPNVEIVVINLERRPDRRNNVLSELKHLRLRASVLAATDGCDTRHLPSGTIVTDTEFACWLSHTRAMRHFLQASPAEVCLILEDDVLLERNLDWPRLLHDLADFMSDQSIDYLQIGRIDWARLSQRRLVRLKRLLISEVSWRIRSIRNLRFRHLDRHFLVSLGETGDGTHAYLISRKFASIVQHHNYPVWTPADNYFAALAKVSDRNPCEKRNLRMALLRPTLAHQASRMAYSQAIDSDIHETSAGS